MGTTLWALSKNLPDSDSIKDPSFRRIIEESIVGIARIGPEGLNLLQTLVTDKDTSVEVRRDAARRAGRIGGVGGKELLQTLAKDSNEKVRKLAIRYLQNL